MLGVILCGGKSLRMGTDKGLLRHNDQLWAKLACDKLEAAGISSVYSVNLHQKEEYSGYLEEERLIVDDARLDVRGPLLGVLSAHLYNPLEHLFILACDLILMEHRLLKTVLDSYKADDSFDAYIFSKQGELEPLCGIYRSSGLNGILDDLEKKKLDKHSMKFMLDRLRVRSIPLADDDFRCFTNFNSHAEINGL